MLNWDERRTLIVPGDHENSLLFCAEHFLKAYQESIALHGSFFVALSGGSTPKSVFSLLTKNPYASKINWSLVHLFWSDERAVPPDHPESNFRMAMDAGFSKVGIPESHIHRMVAEEDIETNAELYETFLRSHLHGKGLDLVLLGMGDDGHTASLFPNTDGLHVKDRWVIANYIPQKHSWRMTFTFSCINASRHIAIYVLGESKQEMLKQIFTSKTPVFPIELVGTPEHKAVWIADQKAAALLPA
jgi:6-phosphogluconolactonase